MITWRNIQQKLRAAAVDTCFLSVSADADFDPDTQFPVGEVVFAGFTCAGRYVRLQDRNPILPQMQRRARLVLKHFDLGIEFVDTYVDGLDIRIFPIQEPK